ncbi:hypothetical protein FH972_021075 [Carpinus fangiana]|uniref:Uncharacterized protein n=1 Tax=Carpinus fangiana TaxID=176857 RepID=A0A5N6KNN3_9ROSI|nr:hypothetical protein FH972_021075 [Carpinus fangiana]
MYYIRFLKQPLAGNISNQYLTLNAVITLTSDLGETTFPEDAQLRAYLTIDGSHNDEKIAKESVTWTASAYSLPIHISFSIKQLRKQTSFRVKIEPEQGCRGTIEGDDHALVLPHLLPTISAPFKPLEKSSVADSLAQRPIPLYGTSSPLAVWEDTGPSIDRHVWDAGIGICGLLSRLLNEPTPAHLPSLATIIRKRSTLRAIELGTGVGLVGIALAHLRYAHSTGATKMLLTDVESARPLAERNVAELVRIGAMKDLAQVACSFLALDWEAALPVAVAEQAFDVVLVSDCTYNPDSGLALVRTLTALAQRSEGLLVMVASKQRHESEAVFWERMKDARFIVVDRLTIKAPMGLNEEDEPEMIAVHLFKY